MRSCARGCFRLRRSPDLHGQQSSLLCSNPNGKMRRLTTHKHDDGQLTQHSQLTDIVNAFPPVLCAFGYGSGVFAQQTSTKTSEGSTSQAEYSKHSNQQQPMIDLLLVVQDAQEFHEANLTQFPHHYAPLPRILGAKHCASVQKLSAGVWFHPMVELCDNNIKYGLVQRDQVVDDLEHWTHLYMAGRLQKPTVLIETDNGGSDGKDLILSLQHERNLPAALAAAVIQLSETTTTTSTASVSTLQLQSSASYSILFQQIAQLSYSGDIRLKVGGEDPQKIVKLVESVGQMERFQTLYKDSLMRLQKKGLLNSTSSDSFDIEWDASEAALQELYKDLPSHVQDKLQQGSSNLSLILQNIVAPAAGNQSLKGLWTAGITNSAKYGAAKLAKGWLY